MTQHHLKGGQGRYTDPNEITELVECALFAIGILFVLLLVFC